MTEIPTSYYATATLLHRLAAFEMLHPSYFATSPKMLSAQTLQIHQDFSQKAHLMYMYHQIQLEALCPVDQRVV